MGSNGTFFFKPAPGEQIAAKLQIDTEHRSAIHGVVLDCGGDPIEDALVLLFKTEGRAATLTAQSYSDGDGHFVFGGLEGDVLYLIKVFKNDIKIRELEIITE